MLTETERHKARFQIYQIDIPGPEYQRIVVAHSLGRALELTVEPEDDLDAGQMMIAWNVTNSWICHSPLAAQSTFSLLKEKREGRVEYDYHEGWQRVAD